MPVTAKLSKAFYDRLGEQIANELVEWFNQVDLTYRNELREFNELNFQRFAARLDERVGASEVKVEVRFGVLEQRMTVFESNMEQRMAAFESRMETRFAELKSELEQRIASFESNMEQRMSALEATLERSLASHTRWMFAVWTALFIPIIGLWFRG